tara:strand:+ start:214 stop:546 length:333 start_codon:yes stop_codon:yes gene_type:complete
MKKISQILALWFQTLIFVLVFSSIVLQPVVKSISGIDSQAFTWLALDSEKDSSEKESQVVEDSKEKKVQLRLTLLDVGSIVFFQTVSNYSLSYFKNDVTIDLHDPPPEVI